MSKGDGPTIHYVLRISKRIEVSVREKNIDPFGFHAVKDNKDSKKDDASAVESEATNVIQSLFSVFFFNIIWYLIRLGFLVEPMRYNPFNPARFLKDRRARL